MILTNSALNFEPSRQYITTLIDELTTSKKCATLKQRSDHKGNSFFPASEHNRACLIVAASWMSKSTLGKFVPKIQRKYCAKCFLFLYDAVEKLTMDFRGFLTITSLKNWFAMNILSLSKTNSFIFSFSKSCRNFFSRTYVKFLFVFDE